MLLQLSNFFLPFIPLCLVPLLPPSFPHLSSCPWVLHICSLASLFPILFLTSSCLFCTYNLCFLFPLLSPPLFSHSLLADNLSCDLYFCESVPLLVVCLVCFSFFLGSVFDSCEFVAFLLFIFFIFFFLLDKSL